MTMLSNLGFDARYGNCIIKILPSPIVWLILDGLSVISIVIMENMTKKSALVLGLCGLFYLPAHACTIPKSDYKNVSCTSQSGLFLASKDDGSPVALLNQKGSKIVDLFGYQAVLANQFQDGLMPALKNGKVGYITRHGQVRIDFQYDQLPENNWARAVSDGVIVVKKQGVWGAIDTRGRTVVGFDRTISQMSDFKNGQSTIKRHNKDTPIDKQGKQIAKTPKAAALTAPTTTTTVPVKPAQNGTPAPKPAANPTTNNSAVNVSTPSPVVDTQPLTAINITTTPKIINTSGFYPHQQNGQWGFVDANGTTMIVYAFDEVKDYSENLAAVRQGDFWGFINRGGDLVIPFRFHKDGFVMNHAKPQTPSMPLIFEAGKAWIGSLANGDKMCINAKGDSVSCQ